MCESTDIRHLKKFANCQSIIKAASNAFPDSVKIQSLTTIYHHSCERDDKTGNVNIACSSPSGCSPFKLTTTNNVKSFPQPKLCYSTPSVQPWKITPDLLVDNHCSSSQRTALSDSVLSPPPHLYTIIRLQCGLVVTETVLQLVQTVCQQASALLTCS